VTLSLSEMNLQLTWVVVLEMKTDYSVALDRRPFSDRCATAMSRTGGRQASARMQCE